MCTCSFRVLTSHGSGPTSLYLHVLLERSIKRERNRAGPFVDQIECNLKVKRSRAARAEDQQVITTSIFTVALRDLGYLTSSRAVKV